MTCLHIKIYILLRFTDLHSPVSILYMYCKYLLLLYLGSCVGMCSSEYELVPFHKRALMCVCICMSLEFFFFVCVVLEHHKWKLLATSGGFPICHTAPHKVTAARMIDAAPLLPHSPRLPFPFIFPVRH